MTIRQPRSSPDLAPSPAAGRGPSAEVRRRVFTAVGELVRRLGYPSVTVDAVARASGVGRSTIYRHWPSRQALVLEAYADVTTRSTPVPDTGDAVEDLRVYLAELAFCLGFGGADTTLPGLVVDALGDPEFAALFRRVLLGERRRAFAAILVRGQRRGQLRTDVDVDVAVDALYGALHHRLLLSGQVVDGPYVAAVVDVVTRGLTVPAAGSAPRRPTPGS